MILNHTPLPPRICPRERNENPKRCQGLASSNSVFWETTVYTEQSSCRDHVRTWHHFARILQTKAQQDPNHSRICRYSRAVSVAWIHRTPWSVRHPTRIGHSSSDRRRDPLCCDLGNPPLLVPAETREATDADAESVDALSREDNKNRFPQSPGSCSLPEKNRLTTVRYEDRIVNIETSCLEKRWRMR